MLKLGGYQPQKIQSSHLKGLTALVWVNSKVEKVHSPPYKDYRWKRQLQNYITVASILINSLDKTIFVIHSPTDAKTTVSLTTTFFSRLLQQTWPLSQGESERSPFHMCFHSQATLNGYFKEIFREFPFGYLHFKSNYISTIK